MEYGLKFVSKITANTQKVIYKYALSCTFVKQKAICETENSVCESRLSICGSPITFVFLRHSLRKSTQIHKQIACDSQSTIQYMALLSTDVSMARLKNDEERRSLISCNIIYGWCLLLVCSFKVLVLFQPPLCCFQSVSLMLAGFSSNYAAALLTCFVQSTELVKTFSADS